MKNLMLPAIVIIELEPLAGRWHVEPGGKHIKLFVLGRLAGILARGGRQAGWAAVSLRSNIRKIVQEHNGERPHAPRRRKASEHQAR